MATNERQHSLDQYQNKAGDEDAEDDLAECPECGESAMSEETPCSRCQPPQPDTADGQEGYSKEQCQNCGSHLSEAFRRVKGDNQNVAHACPDCMPKNHEFPYAVAGVDTDGIPVIQR